MTATFDGKGGPRIAIVTGAHGGIGQACARALGDRFDLVLTDRDAQRLEVLAQSLRSRGYRVRATVAGDLLMPRTLPTLIDAARAAGPVGAIVHAAGLSPALAGWEAILRTNLVATLLLLNELERKLEPGFTAVLVASIAAHVAAADETIDHIVAVSDVDDLVDRLRGPLKRLASPNDDHSLARVAYQQSKRAVLKICERRALTWALSRARVVTLSPGVIDTPMGRLEAETNPHTVTTIAATPMGRLGTPQDIARAAAFLVSDGASFITGCDLRVDGGVTAVLSGRGAWDRSGPTAA